MLISNSASCRGRCVMRSTRTGRPRLSSSRSESRPAKRWQGTHERIQQYKTVILQQNEQGQRNTGAVHYQFA